MGIRVGPAPEGWGMTPELAAQHDLGDAIPAGGYPEPKTPTFPDVPAAPRPWTWGGEQVGGR
jgi:hypothetical protein